MPTFSDPWDVATPAGTDQRSAGDDRIRELKRALKERYETEHDFPVSTGSGSGRHKFPRGNTASRPTDVVAGSLYINTQTGNIEYYDGAAWQVGVVITGFIKADGTVPMAANLDLGGFTLTNVLNDSIAAADLAVAVRNGSALVFSSVAIGGNITLTSSYQDLLTLASLTFPADSSTRTFWLLGNFFASISGVSGSPTLEYRVLRDATVIFTSGATSVTSFVPDLQIPGVSVVDSGFSTGAHVYKMQARVNGTATVVIKSPSNLFGFAWNN